jgi:membrane-bound lytic murein transglycosylase MltF
VSYPGRKSHQPLLLLACLAMVPFAAQAQATAAPAPAAEVPAKRTVTVDSMPRTGDLDVLMEDRIIRVGVPYSRSLLFLEHGRQRGLSADLVKEFERWFNARERRNRTLRGRPVSVVIVPTTRERLLPDLLEGRIDIAGGNLTATPERRAQADFITTTSVRTVSEIVVTGPGAPPLDSLDDLAGMTIHSRPSTSYWTSLERLNERFREQGKPPVNIVALPDALEDEDKLDMVNVGILQVAIIDDWLARAWSSVLPGIMLHEDLVLASGERTGWAIRKDSPQLSALLRQFEAEAVRPVSLVPVLRNQLNTRIGRMSNNAARADRDRFDQMIGLFRQYGGRYHLDPLMLAALGYQESQLRQDARSPVGAIGVMQLMPATGNSLNVGDIRQLEPNIHAGARYLDRLMTRYFQNADFDEMNRTLFAFAAYNAGPTRMQQMRRLAGERGLDPDVWFNNVEMVVAERIGLETTTYVRNILKYFVAYSLIEQTRATRREALQALPEAAQ